MDAINKAVSEVYYSIPAEIINLGFNDNPQHMLQSVDQSMLSRVIRPRVLVDCNLVGGIEIYIPIGNCIITSSGYGQTNEYLIEVPKSVTNNKSLITVIGLFSAMGLGSGGGARHTALGQALNDQMNGVSMPTVISTSRLELIGENRVLVTQPATSFNNGVLKCVVENNDNLSNISPRSYPNFSVLVTLAVKAYIHNSLIVKLGKGYIYNGHELGVVNDIINEYSTANEEYLAYLHEVWAKVAYHNDRTRLTNYIVGMI